MMAEGIARCLRECLSPRNGELTTWTPASVKAVKGLPEYLLASGVWRLIVALSSICPTLKFRQADMEAAVQLYMPEAEPHKICVEAKKLLDLLNGWRRVTRHHYAVPDQLRRLMASHKRKEKDPIIESFWMLEDDCSDPSLESCESDAADPSPAAAAPSNAASTASASHTSMDKCDNEYVLNEAMWAVRVFDKEEANSSTPTKDGKIIFTWSDGDRWVSTMPNVKAVQEKVQEAKTPAKAKKMSKAKAAPVKERMTAMEEDISIADARELCWWSGAWKVGVHPRPKMKDGGWEVYIKHGNAQKWSKASCSKTKVGDGSLTATIEQANELMFEMKNNADGTDEGDKTKKRAKKTKGSK